MQIRFNGEVVRLGAGRLERGAGMSLQQVLVQLGLLGDEQNGFVVAHNQTLVSSERYSTTLVNEGDQLDVLGVITGG